MLTAATAAAAAKLHSSDDTNIEDKNIGMSGLAKGPGAAEHVHGT